MKIVYWQRQTSCTCWISRFILRQSFTKWNQENEQFCKYCVDWMWEKRNRCSKICCWASNCSEYKRFISEHRYQTRHEQCTLFHSPTERKRILYNIKIEIHIKRSFASCAYMPVYFFSFYVVVIHITLCSGFFVWLEQHNNSICCVWCRNANPLPPNSLLVEPCSLLFIQMNVDNDRTHIPNLWPEIVHNRCVYAVRGFRLKKKTTVCLSLDCMLILLLMVAQSFEACWIPVFTADNTSINQFK